jgi:signal peptidase I
MTAPTNTPATPPANAKPGPSVPASKRPPAPAKQESMRETIESIAVAFLLAFLFRAFEAEAFVIPTGSMAPTLYGRHKETNCSQCGHLITIGASEELDRDGVYLTGRLESSLCPNCRAPNSIKDAPVFRGDRILVNKFPFELKEPRRWDVVVFKYPEEPKTNYIKRLVGLPNETLIIRQGDLYRSEPGGGETTILRKADPNKQREIQILVHDNDYLEKPLIEQGWPTRWASVARDDGDRFDHEAAATGGASSPIEVAGWRETKDGWQSRDEMQAFELTNAASKDKQPHWLRYRHFVPTPDVWRAVLKTEEGDRLNNFGGNGAAALKNPRPQLITDFCGYNAFSSAHDFDLESYYWVGDLTLGCNVKIDQLAESAELVLELNKGVHRFRCRINPNSGEAQLLRVVWLNRGDEEEDLLAKATTSLQGTGQHRVEFANVDQRLCLWIDGRLIDFGGKSEYTLSEVENLGPQEEDLTPIGIAARGMNVEVSHLQIHRDIYYQSTHEQQTQDFSPLSSHLEEWLPCSSHAHPRNLLSNPAAWWESYQTCHREARFDLGPDEFLMLGDNSPKSKDSRLWENDRRAKHRHAVPRSALVGKAFYIYWPHGQPFLNGGEGFPVWYHKKIEHKRMPDGSMLAEETKTDYPDVRLPFYPNFGRMHRIR